MATKTPSPICWLVKGRMPMVVVVEVKVEGWGDRDNLTLSSNSPAAQTLVCRVKCVRRQWGGRGNLSCRLQECTPEWSHRAPPPPPILRPHPAPAHRGRISCADCASYFLC